MKATLYGCRQKKKQWNERFRACLLCTRHKHNMVVLVVCLRFPYSDGTEYLKGGRTRHNAGLKALVSFSSLLIIEIT
jgi:hypothetical protein